MSTSLPPELLNQLHPTKTLPTFDAEKIQVTSKYWWQCSRGHEWEAKVVHRLNGTGCPYCSNRKVIPGFNDLASVSPALGKEWHPTRNLSKEGGILSSSEIPFGSGRRAVWQCSKKHIWEATVDERFRRGNGCPYCSGRYAISGETDLATKFPEIASEWHPTKNGDVVPSHVTAHSSKKYWWLGACSHEWETTIAKRSIGRGCPYCAFQKVLKGFNDLATTHPEIAKTWHPIRNRDLAPDMFIGSGRDKIWWQCSEGHEWETTINARKTGSDCHYCTGQKAITGVNDLATLDPILLSEWHPTKNGELTPDKVTIGSNRKVWWLGACGHEWEAVINGRAKEGRRYGCPKCPTMVSQAEKDIAEFVQGLLPDVLIEFGARKVIKGTELDIYLPALKVAIEFNGLYWHSEDVRPDRNYHYTKWLACQEAGIQLVQVWADDWERSPELVKNMLAYKLGVSSGVRVLARETRAVELSKEAAGEFLEAYHIQGNVVGRVRVGLMAMVDGVDTLVAVMVLKNEPGSGGRELNLHRFATSVQVVGGFTKLLKFVERSYPEVEGVVTFSDNALSDGGLYEGNGFVKVKDVAPDYMYIYKGVRSHKFNFRLKSFRNNSELLFEDGLTEGELASLNKLRRIWDAGKVKWRKSFR